MKNIKDKDIEELYYTFEELNAFFHNESHYEKIEDVKKFADKIYPKIKRAYYEITWNMLTDELRNKIQNE